MNHEPPITKREKITPALAKRWLGENRVNRPLNQRIVLQYAVDMESGAWRIDGETIKFDWDGNLIDGQHRLEACILAETPFETHVCRSLDPAVKYVIDTGYKRTLGHVLVMMGEPNSSALATAINWCWRLQHVDSPGIDSAGHTASRPRNPTHAEALIWLQANPGIRESVVFAGRMAARFRYITRSVCAGMHYLASTGDPEVAERFWEQVADGINLHEGEPALTFRRYLERNYEAGTGRRNSEMLAGVAIKAWNAYVVGKRMRVLGWYPGRGEEFPTMLIPDPPPAEEVEAA